MTQESTILRGPIPRTGLVPLVQAIGIGRQTNVVQLLDASQRVLGQLVVRSGKVLDVELGEVRGLAALAGFVAQREGTFEVRSIHGLPPSEPLGELRNLLREVGTKLAEVSLIRGLDAPSEREVETTGVQILPVLPEPKLRVAEAPAPMPTPPPPAPVAPIAAPVAPVAVEAPPVAARRPTLEDRLPPDADVPVVAIASAKGGAGKTTLAMNVAVSLARRGMRVILVDADPNGGVSASVNGHRRFSVGALDVACGVAELGDALVTTRMEGLVVLPAGGTSLSIERLEEAQSNLAGWRALLASLTRRCDVVIVDTAGGVYGSSRALLSCATHVLGVLQAEPLALRAMEHLDRALAATSPRPAFVGVAMNMFDARGATSTEVLKEACDAFAPGLLFDTSIPRTAVIRDASLRGILPAQGDLADAPAVAWAFEQLGAELLERLRPEMRKTRGLEEAPLF